MEKPPSPLSHLKRDQLIALSLSDHTLARRRRLGWIEPKGFEGQLICTSMDIQLPFYLQTNRICGLHDANPIVAGQVGLYFTILYKRSSFGGNEICIANLASQRQRQQK
jgi:hypothetical protein